MSRVVYLNGDFVPEPQAVVGVYDAAFLHGAGLFETMRAEQGRVFRLEAHLSRLMTSASELLAPLERSALPSPAAFESLLERNGLREARVRLTVTAGSMLQPATDAAPTLTVCVTASDLGPYAPQAYRDGVPVMIARRKQAPDDPLAGHKSTCYLPRLLTLRMAHAARCSEALFFTSGNELAEGAISNVFIVRHSRLRTPPLGTPVLPGIARAVVIELTERLDIDMDDRTPITIDDLLDADEVFLTNTCLLYTSPSPRD